MDKKTIRNLLIIIISIGILIRILSIFFIQFENLQIDTGINPDVQINYEKIITQDESSLYKNGTVDYILQLFYTHKLYQNNLLLAYHPPLFFFLCAIVLSISLLFTKEAYLLLLSINFFILILSLLSILVFTKIMKEVGFSSLDVLLPLSLSFFIPLHIYMSRLVTNDQLVFLFSLILLLCLIKWYKNPKMKYIILGSLALGLGGMSKTSIVVMLIPMAYVFFKKYYMLSKAKDIQKTSMLYKHLVVLFLIASPLFLWYPLRNYVLFNQPLFYVTSPDENLAVKSTNFIDRWLINKEIISDNYYKDDSNILSGVIKLSIIFDELPLRMNSLVFIPLMILIIFMIILSIIGIFKGKNNYKDIIFVTYISWIISFIYFNIRFPYSCTFHPRYIVMPIYMSYIFIQLLLNSTNNKLFKKIVFTTSVATILLSLLSCINMMMIF